VWIDWNQLKDNTSLNGQFCLNKLFLWCGFHIVYKLKMNI
jgi:hypothetical protein